MPNIVDEMDFQNEELKEKTKLSIGKASLSGLTDCKNTRLTFC